MNKVILMGRLTKDPEIRYTQGANPMSVCRYSLAVNRQFKRDGEPEADFFNCVTFGKRAEFAGKYLKKGTMIAVVGEIRNNSYTDRDGNKRNSTEIVVNEHYFAGSNQTGGNQSATSGGDFAPANEAPSQPVQRQNQRQQQSTQPPDEFMPVDTDFEGDDDLPF